MGELEHEFTFIRNKKNIRQKTDNVIEFFENCQMSKEMTGEKKSPSLGVKSPFDTSRVLTAHVWIVII